MGLVLAMGLALVMELLFHLATVEWGQYWQDGIPILLGHHRMGTVGWGWCWLWGT